MPTLDFVSPDMLSHLACMNMEAHHATLDFVSPNMLSHLACIIVEVHHASSTSRPRWGTLLM